MKSHLKLRFLVSTLAALMLSLAALPALAAPNTAVAHGIGRAPAGLVAAIARTQAREAAQNPAYAIGKNGCAKLGNRNNAPLLTGCFGQTGPAFSMGKQTLRLRLSAWGRAGRLQPVTLTRTAPEANRIAYRGRHIVEWWRVLPLGYEQGFTLNQAPQGTGKVVLQLTASAAPTVHAGTLAWGRLRYGKLQVTDAHGTVLPATLTARGKTITLVFNAAHARYPVTVDPLVWMQQEVTASDGAAGDRFGTSVALSSAGTTALVGAYFKTVSSNSYQGAAYVYTLANGSWSQAAELTASNGAANDSFGFSVALSADGTTALVGADNKTVGSNSYQGAAYVYTAPSTGWASTSAYTAELTASDGAAYDEFGSSVALSSTGTTVLVGADSKTVGSNTQQGAAYVYTAPSNGWATTSTFTAVLTASDGAAGDNFGWSVALSAAGTTALVGVMDKTVGVNTQQGAAYVYTAPSGGWATTSAFAAELTAADGARANRFGWSVALSADDTTALVGADQKGAAYVYAKPSGGWTSTAAYTAELTVTTTVNDWFGSSVALSANGTTALVGAWGKTVGTNTQQGAAYVYAKPSGGWVTSSAYTAELTASDGAAGDNFGWSVALSAAGTTALVGANNKNNVQGAAYFFGRFDLSAVLSAPATVVQGGQFDSRYILTNAGATTSAPLTVKLPLPALNAGHISQSASQGSCTYDTTAKVATCILGAIAGNGGTASATLTLKATGTLNSNIVQSAQLANGLPDLLRISGTNITPPPPTLSGLGNVTVTTPGAGSETFTLAGSGTLTLTATSSNPTLLPNANISGASSCIAASSCTLTLTPAANQTGSAAVTVTVTDAYNQSAAGVFIFTVQPAPTSPVANNLSLTTYENIAISTNLSAGAPNGDALSYALAASPTHGTVTVTAATGAFTYTPNSGYSGSDSFTFTAKDTVTGLTSNTATVTITVNPTPPPGQVAPVASNLTLTTYAGQALAGTLPAVVTPSSDALSYAIASQPTHGTVTVNATTGAFTYTPNSGYSGSDSFTFTAKDTVTGLTSNTATVTITVNPTPPPGQVAPVASNLTLTTYTGQALSGTLPAVVTPSSDALSYAVTQPTNGTVTVNATTGIFTYTPASGYSGSDSFTFTAKDTVTGLGSNTATVSITVNPTPPPGQVPPVASNLTLTTYTGQALAGTLPAVVTPSSDTLSYALASSPANGTVTVNAGSGAFTYTPASGYSGSDSFTFTAKDTVTGLSSNIATVSITVNPTPPPGQVPPVASNLTLTTYTGQTLAGTLPTVVTPSSDTLSYAIAAQPTHGTVTVTAATGAFTYTPASGYSGNDSFTFTAKDTVTGLVSNTATVSITVNAVPPPGQVPPVASNLTLTTYTGQALSGILPAVVTPSSDTLSYALASSPANGTVTVNATTGAFTYTPTAGYAGSDSFTFKAKDTVTGLTSNIATVKTTIKATPSSPASGGGSGGGGGGFGPLALFGLLLIALVPWWLRRRGTRSNSTQSTEDIPMKLHLKLRFLVSTLAALMLSLAALPALAATTAPGDIDTTFNGGVPAVIDLNPNTNIEPYAAAMNPLNSDILWAGYYESSTDRGGAIAVYTPGGTGDPAVGGGTGTINLTADQVGFTGGVLWFTAIAVDGQGRILAAGEVDNSNSTADDMVLARFNPDGTPDATFGGANTGYVLSALNTYASGNGLSLTADGHILVTGAALDASGTESQLTVWRFLADGQVDAGFGSNSTGYVQIAQVNDPMWVSCYPALQPDGPLIVGCDQIAGSWMLTRLTTDGAVDTAFGTNGFITGAANMSLGGIALAPDGGFVISEYDQSTSPPPVDLRRYLADGTVDTGFHSGSPLQLIALPGWRFPVAVQPDGKILFSSNDGGNGLYIVRYLANGQGDTNFGSGGTSDIKFSSINGYDYTPYPTALLVQGNGKIVASGWADSTAGSNYAAFVTRVLSDTYDLTPSAPAFNDVTRAPLGQAVASNAVTVGGVSIGGNTSGVNVALITLSGKYGSSTGGPFVGSFTGFNVAWVPAGSPLALEQMTPTTGGTATTTTVTLGGFWAANNYEVPLGSPAAASWTTTTDQPPVASNGSLSAKTGKASTGTLSATNPSSGTLAFAILTPPGHGTATITNPATGAYSYTSAGGYTGTDSFTWKVNDGVADSNTATVSVTVKKAPPSGGGGGGFGDLGLLGLALLGFGAMFRKRRMF